MPGVAGAPFRVQDEETKRRQLAAMKRRASGLLAAVAVLFVVTLLLEDRWPWLAAVRAFAEAAMVGGIADWFAVVALFRHPLGIPIPHTAIVPTRKDRIGRSLGGFIQSNFLAPEVIAARVRPMGLGARGARWLAEPSHARQVARHIAAALSAATERVPDEAAREMIGGSVVRRLQDVPVTPLLSDALDSMASGNRHQALLDRAVDLLARLVADHKELIRAQVRSQSPWWIPTSVDEKIYAKIVAGLEATLRDVAVNPAHPLRERFDTAIHELVERLRHSPELIARAEKAKRDLLASEAVRQMSESIWDEMKRGIARYAARYEDAAGMPPTLAPGAVPGGDATTTSASGAPGLPGTAVVLHDAPPPTALERATVRLAEAVLADPALLERVDGWIVDAIMGIIARHRDDVGRLITDTVGAWDAHATAEKIELQVGRDLQFIRINGTLVGGLVGLLLYLVQMAI